MRRVRSPRRELVSALFWLDCRDLDCLHYENPPCIACCLDFVGRVGGPIVRSRRTLCAGHRQREISGCRSAAEGADQRRARHRRRAQARRLQCRHRREPDRRADAPRLRTPLWQDQAGIGCADFLLRLWRAVEPAELHDPGRCADLDRAGRAPRRFQPRDGAGRDQQPRRRRQDRPDRCFQAQSVRAPIPQFFRRPRAGDCAERHAGDVFGRAFVGDLGKWQRPQPVREGAAEGNPHPRPDGGRNAEPYPRRRHPRLAQRAGAVDFVVARRGFLLHSQRRGPAAVEPAACRRRSGACHPHRLRPSVCRWRRRRLSRRPSAAAGSAQAG